MKMRFVRRSAQGFGAIAAIVVLVILALLAAAIVAVGSAQQMTSVQDVQSARAWQTARAGNEWGLYMALKSQNWAGANTSCDAGSRSSTLDLTASTGFYVTVVCDSWLYNEGESVPGTPQTVRVYRITATACPVNGCDSTATSGSAPGYIERRRIVFATNN